MKGNKNVYEEIMSLIGSAKARLMKHTALTSSNALQLNKNCNVSDLATPPPDPEEDKEIKENKSTKDMQSLLISKLHKKEYEKVSKLYTESGGNKFQSYYSIAIDLPKVRELKFQYDLISSSESAISNDDGTMDAGSLNNEHVTTVDSDKEKVVSVVGMYVSFGDCVKGLLKKIEEVISKTKGVTMEQTMERSNCLTRGSKMLLLYQ